MSTVLVLTSSALGDASVSNELVRDAVSRLTASDPGLRVITRDVGVAPIPHLTADSAAAIRGGDPANAAQAKALTLSNELVAELKTADTVIIGAPMYNFGIASTLKAWFDYVLRAGVTFRYSEKGPEGLLKGKRAIVIESRGGLYSHGPAQTMDSQEPHIRTLLGFVGITDVTFVRAEKLAMGQDTREQILDAARADLGRALAA